MFSAPEKVHQATFNSGSELVDTTFAERYPLDILIAEDNFVNQKLIERILIRLGYRTETVSDGAQAVNSIGKSNYNVILMDVRMPEMDGLEATRMIRKMAIKQPYIIAMTANVMTSDREECVQYGMNNYIPKPICMDEVISKLKIASEYCSKQ